MNTIMSLTPAQMNKIRTWLEQNVPNNQCDSCGASNWQVGDIFAPTVVYHGKNIDIVGDCRPMLQVICGNCARVILFDAGQIGVVKGKDQCREQSGSGNDVQNYVSVVRSLNI